MQKRPEGGWPIPEHVERARSIAAWKRVRFTPSDAWVSRDEASLVHKPRPGEKFDPVIYERQKDGWEHEHCMLCMTTISQISGTQSEGYTDGYNWLCVACYETYIAHR